MSETGTTPSGNGDVATLAEPHAEAPASANARIRINGIDWQVTIRSYATFEDVKAILKRIEWFAEWSNKHAAPTSRAAADAINTEQQKAPAAPPAPPAASAPAPAPAVLTGPQESGCAMIEIGTAYSSGKPQLKFHVNGFEKPLLYTRGVEDMVKLLAPLGFTAAHIVVGQKYPVNAIVTHAPYQKDGKTYHNVTAVRPA